MASPAVQAPSELDWWDRTAGRGALDFTLVPAQHWSKRTLTDTNRSAAGRRGDGGPQRLRVAAANPTLMLRQPCGGDFYTGVSIRALPLISSLTLAPARPAGSRLVTAVPIAYEPHGSQRRSNIYRRGG